MSSCGHGDELSVSMKPRCLLPFCHYISIAPQCAVAVICCRITYVICIEYIMIQPTCDALLRCRYGAAGKCDANRKVNATIVRYPSYVDREPVLYRENHDACMTLPFKIPS
jgi:hypothetical protein